MLYTSVLVISISINIIFMIYNLISYDYKASTIKNRDSYLFIFVVGALYILKSILSNPIDNFHRSDIVFYVIVLINLITVVYNYYNKKSKDVEDDQEYNKVKIEQKFNTYEKEKNEDLRKLIFDLVYQNRLLKNSIGSILLVLEASDNIIISEKNGDEIDKAWILGLASEFQKNNIDINKAFKLFGEEFEKYDATTHETFILLIIACSLENGGDFDKAFNKVEKMLEKFVEGAHKMSVDEYNQRLSKVREKSKTTT